MGVSSQALGPKNVGVAEASAVGADLGREAPTARRTWFCWSMPVGGLLFSLIFMAIYVLPLRAGSPTAVAMFVPREAEESKHMAAADCARCHGVEPRFSHPTNKTTSFETPEIFPLDEGKVTCTTCHLDSTRDHSQARTRKTAMLRANALTGTAWCRQCHQGVASTRQAQHPGAVARAHTPGSFKSNGLTQSLGTIAATYAETSRSCLGCHDGTVARDGFPTAGSNLAAAGGYPGHTVDVMYNNPQSPNRQKQDRKLVAKAALDSRIHLVNDQVACSSCHSMYSSEKKLLVMSNRESKLCLSCHAMQ